MNFIRTALSTAGGFLGTYKVTIIAVLATAALCLPLGYCEGKSAERARNEAARALANVKALETDAQATEAASADRVADALEVSEQEEVLLDAISEVPDTRPDPVRVKLGCQRLRDQGTASADLPAVCRPASGDGSEADSAP